ncbi:MAG: hypothetical protein FGM35_05435 [Rhodocyclaceae bacterium]|nr:hypothetical protein [Rhodocyclaceae bacterium]
MNTEKFINDWRPQYQVRAETADMVRRELQGIAFERDIEKFIQALGPVLPNARDLARLTDTEALKAELDEMEGLYLLSSRLLAHLNHSRTSARSLALDALGEDGIEALRTIANESREWIADFAHLRAKQNGPKNDDTALFVALVAHHWQAQMPDMAIAPSGAFKRICEEIVRLEGLPFKITRPAIERGLQQSL